MSIKYGSPTFLFRDKCPTQLNDIMKQLARTGFDGIELFGMFGFKSDDIFNFCRENKMEIICDHIKYEEFSNSTEEVIKLRAATGARFLTIDNIPKEKLPGNPGFNSTVKEIERISGVCKKYGIQLLYHNHGYDLLNKVDGIPVLDIILDSTDPELLKFQPDLGWIALGGEEPLVYLEKYRSRCPVIHLKDYYAAAPTLLESPFPLGNSRGGREYNNFEFRPSGFGIMNFPLLMPKIMACNPEWITTDHDLSYERDTYADLKIGLDYTKFLVSISQ